MGSKPTSAFFSCTPSGVQVAVLYGSNPCVVQLKIISSVSGMSGVQYVVDGATSFNTSSNPATGFLSVPINLVPKPCGQHSVKVSIKYSNNTPPVVLNCNFTGCSTPTSTPCVALGIEPRPDAFGGGPCAYTFESDQINAPGTWTYDFGDGVSSSGQSGVIINGVSNTIGFYDSPTHTYTTSGNFIVTATFVPQGGGPAICCTVTVRAVCQGVPLEDCRRLGADWKIDGANPCFINFIHSPTVSGPGTWSYDFGDGITSTGNTGAPVVAVNQTTGTYDAPNHEYTQNGTYNVVVTYTDLQGVSIFCRLVVEVKGCCELNIQAAQGATSCIQMFTHDASYNDPNGLWSYDFGDGTGSFGLFGQPVSGFPNTVGTNDSPIHTYANSGTYTVMVTYLSPKGELTICNIEVVVVGCSNVECLLGIQAQINEKEPCEVAFSHSPNLDNPLCSWFYDFGDGITSSGLGGLTIAGVQNTTGTYDSPIHTYAQAGTYTVTVTYLDIFNNKTICNLTVIVAACEEEPGVCDFTADININCSRLTVNVEDLNNPNGQHFWNFGDGTPLLSGINSEEHQYVNINTYAPNNFRTITHTYNGQTCQQTIELPEAIFIGLDQESYCGTLNLSNVETFLDGCDANPALANDNGLTNRTVFVYASDFEINQNFGFTNCNVFYESSKRNEGTTNPIG